MKYQMLLTYISEIPYYEPARQAIIHPYNSPKGIFDILAREKDLDNSQITDQERSVSANLNILCSDRHIC